MGWVAHFMFVFWLLNREEGAHRLNVRNGNQG
jgi:hypothetical protein